MKKKVSKNTRRKKATLRFSVFVVNESVSAVVDYLSSQGWSYYVHHYLVTPLDGKVEFTITLTDSYNPLILSFDDTISILERNSRILSERIAVIHAEYMDSVADDLPF